MSNRAITWAYGQTHAQLKAGAKFILVALADLADQDHSCFPGVTQLAQMTSSSPASVKRGLTQLADLGYITAERRHRKDGSRTSNRYYLAVEQEPESAPDIDPDSLSVNLSPSDSDQVSNRTNLSLNLSHPRAQIEPPILEPLVNPQIEPTVNSLIVIADSPADDTDAQFAQFWKIWPRHDAKKVALAKFKLAAKKLPAVEIVAAAQAWLTARTALDPQFVPHAATWLNQERWNDEAPSPGGGRPLTNVERNLLDYQARYGGSDGPETNPPALDQSIGDR